MSYATNLQALLAELVYEGLDRKAWSQAQLARKAKVSEKHLSRILTGKDGGTVALWDRLLGAVAEDG